MMDMSMLPTNPECWPNFGIIHSGWDRYEDLFYGRKAQEISRLWATECIAGCADCAFQSICGADPVRNYSTQGDMYGFRPTSTFCRKHKAIIEHIFGLLTDRREEVLPIFKSWITGTRG